MLVSLHVKNFAIIDEVWVDFGPGFNVLTGETGAGKSILLGSVTTCLGGRVSRDFLGHNGDYALVELIFDCNNERIRGLLKLYDLPVEEQLIISRKIMENGRSVSRINGETVSAAILKEAASLLLDIHGQQESQLLLHRTRHLDMLDRYARSETKQLLQQVKKEYAEYRKLKDEYSDAMQHSEGRQREIAMMTFETEEIDAAALKPGEDTTLEERYLTLQNTAKIEEAVSMTEELLSEGNSSTGEMLGRAMRQLSRATNLDAKLSGIYEEMTIVEEQLNDVSYKLKEYAEELGGSEEEYQRTEERLNTINRLKSKYGKTIESILSYSQKTSEKLERFLDYDGYLAELKLRTEASEQVLAGLCERLTSIRKAAAETLSAKIRKALLELNFIDVKFDIAIEPLLAMTDKGRDNVEFLISTNPGEPVRPLEKIASGGELSRVMLALKSVFAGKDEIETLIFDEIDVGVSGRTAQKVAEKIATISKEHQILCITHLPQIAAMADTHFLIEKAADAGNTKTSITKLDEERQIEELARILGGAQITQSVLDNAKEMKQLATERKNLLHEA